MKTIKSEKKVNFYDTVEYLKCLKMSQFGRVQTFSSANTFKTLRISDLANNLQFVKDIN